MRPKNKISKAMMLANLAIFFSFLGFFFGTAFFWGSIVLGQLAFHFSEEYEKQMWGPKTVNTRVIAAFLLPLIWIIFRFCWRLMI